MMTFSIFIVFVLTFINHCVNSQSVCATWKTVNHTVFENRYVTYTQTYTDRCINNNWYYYSCQKTRITGRMQSTPITRTRNELSEECCEGYARTEGVSKNDNILLRTPIKCHPVCFEGCDNGTCVSPNVCVCENGYELVNGKCNPICKNECGLHGTCVSPENCLCDAGYEYHQKSLLCVPRCSDGCVHGTCATPNHCVCNDGFVLTLGTCRTYDTVLSTLDDNDEEVSTVSENLDEYDSTSTAYTTESTTTFSANLELQADKSKILRSNEKQPRGLMWIYLGLSIGIITLVLFVIVVLRLNKSSFCSKGFYGGTPSSHLVQDPDSLSLQYSAVRRCECRNENQNI